MAENKPQTRPLFAGLVGFVIGAAVTTEALIVIHATGTLAIVGAVVGGVLAALGFRIISLLGRAALLGSRIGVIVAFGVLFVFTNVWSGPRDRLMGILFLVALTAAHFCLRSPTVDMMISKYFRKP